MNCDAAAGMSAEVPAGTKNAVMRGMAADAADGMVAEVMRR
jgi:hypothetical protein